MIPSIDNHRQLYQEDNQQNHLSFANNYDNNSHFALTAVPIDKLETINSSFHLLSKNFVKYESDELGTFNVVPPCESSNAVYGENLNYSLNTNASNTSYQYQNDFHTKLNINDLSPISCIHLKSYIFY